MRVFVTGATGFIGRRLAERLTERGHSVTALVRPASNGQVLQLPGVRVAHGDVTDRKSLDDAIHGSELVYHAAGLRWAARAGRDQYHDVNVRGTENVLSAALRHDAQRVVFCSSIAVYGLPRRIPVAEDGPIRPRTGYGRSKVQAEAVVRDYATRHGLTTVNARITGTYGPGSGDLNGLFERIGRQQVFLTGPQSPVWSRSYIDDVVDGLMLCGTEPVEPGEAFNIGAEASYRLDEAAAAIAENLEVPLRIRRLPAPTIAAARSTVRHMPWLRFQQLLPLTLILSLWNFSFSMDKARRRLGFEPRVSLADGIARTITWYRQQEQVDTR